MDTTSTHADPIGTMHYMSFEQHRRKPLDFRTDLYSLGIVMYRCLSGKFPYGHAAARVREDILEALFMTEAPRIQTVSDQLCNVV